MALIHPSCPILTKQTGKTIIMTIHQPAKDESEKFTHCLVKGYGGVLP
jgi:hypothetical protein